MKLPRWLSPVRTVEAETGWPRPLSRQFASHIEDRFFWRDLLVGSVVAAAIAWPWSEAAWRLLRLAFGADGPPWPPQVTAIVALLVVPGLAFGPLFLCFSHRRRLSKLAAFRARPWCLKCRYPVPEAASGARAPVCPECGEPIPPEIAAFAAGRGDATG